MSDFVAFVLDGLDDLYLLGNTSVVREHFEESFRPFMDILGLLGEKVEETLFARHEALQKSWHVVTLP